MYDHSIYILYSLSSKDSQRTLRKLSVRPVVNLSHAPKLFLRGLNIINPVKTVRNCPGTEGFSQISRIPRAKRESVSVAIFCEPNGSFCTFEPMPHYNGRETVLKFNYI